MEVSDLYESLKDDLHRFAISISRHEQEAFDLVQDALLKAIGETHLFDLPIYKQRAWFYRVMKNRMIDERRKSNRLIEWDEDLDFSVEEAAVSRLEITELLSHLSWQASDIIFKRYWLGLSSQEIGKQLEIPAATVRYKLHLAVKQLKALLKEEKA